METIIAIIGLYGIFKLMRATLPAHVEPDVLERKMSRSEYRANARKYI